MYKDFDFSYFLLPKDSEEQENLIQSAAKNARGKSEEILIRYQEDAQHLEMNDKGDWVDLYCYEDSFVKDGQQQYISQGVSMKLPDGYEAIMAPRSSTYKNWGIIQTNGIGVIDNSYCGNDDIWMFPAKATRGDIFIPKGTRICQFRIQKKQPDLIFKEVDSLNNENRGGFGSSGK